MRFGFVLPNILSPLTSASDVRHCARLSEDVGFDSLWVSDHVLVPEEKSAYASGGEALMTLAYVAAITQRVALGLSVLILPMRNPVITAKQIATLHSLSEGRDTIVGVGVGWCKEEYEFLNADFHRRGKLMDEYIEIMRKLWTEERAAHSGTYHFSGALFSPRPERPLPVWIGGESEAAMKRAAIIGDGYQPNPFDTIAEFAAAVARVRELSNGRAVTISSSLSFEMSRGTQAAVDEFSAYREAGLEYPVMRFKHETLGELLHHIEAFGSRVLPALR
jgi:probable F420-dependent oxidoreductase